MKKIISTFLVTLIGLSASPMNVFAETTTEKYKEMDCNLSISSYSNHYFMNNKSVTNFIALTSTTQFEAESFMESRTSLQEIDETYFGKIGVCSWKLNTKIGTLYITGNGAMPNYSSSSDYPWNKYKEYIKRVEIADGVTTIGSYAFDGCSGITGTIEIPKSVHTMGKCAFRGTQPTKLIIPFIGDQRGETISGDETRIYYIFSGSLNSAHLYMPTTLTEIEITNGTVVSPSAFYECNNITKVKLNEGITTISTSAFSGKSQLTEVNIPTTVTSIGDYAFSGCSGLTSITIPDGVTLIGDYAFNNCSELTSITTPNKATNIGDYAFAGCSKLTNITILGKIIIIGESTFYNCTNLTSIKLPNSVKTIGSSAFMNCSNLTSIKIPSKVTSIGSRAFYNCSGLTNLTISNSVKNIGYAAFYNCTNLNKVYYLGDNFSNIYIDSYGNQPLLEASLRPLIMGDVNIDATVDLRDVIVTLRYITGSVECDYSKLLCADVNEDDNISVLDAVLMQRCILGDADTF